MLVALGGRFPRTHLDDPAQLLARWRIPLGAVLSLGFGAVFVVLFFRRDLFGEDYGYSLFTDSVVRSFDEMNMPWLSWFVTIRGLVIMWLGLCVVLLQRWRASLFALVGTGVLLLPLYLYDARVSMRLMWWVRRSSRRCLPVIVILMAIAIGWALTRRWKIVQVAGGRRSRDASRRVRAHVVAPSRPRRDGGLVGPVGRHRCESRRPGRECSCSLSRRRAIYDVERNAPGIVWFVFDQVAARLPPDYDISTVDEYQQAFPDLPVFVVSPGESLPDRATR